MIVSRLSSPAPLLEVVAWPILALVLIAIAAVASGPLAAFIDVPSLVIVLGGTAVATGASFPAATLRTLPAVFHSALFGRLADGRRHRRQTLRILAEASRRSGPRGLHAAMAAASIDPLTRYGAELVADGVAAEHVDRAMQAAAERLLAQHAEAESILERAAEIAPAMGLIGTLLGLVRMLDTLDRPEALGPAMAVALLTTFYAAILANIVLHPMAARLRVAARELTADLDLVVRGVAGIAAGEHPERLDAALADVPLSHAASPRPLPS